jgi:hypothetical protein
MISQAISWHSPKMTMSQVTLAGFGWDNAQSLWPRHGELVYEFEGFALLVALGTSRNPVRDCPDGSR